MLTHRPRPSIEMEGGTTFHFLDAAPAEALETAREAADGQDVRIGGGPTVVRDFLAAGLVDHMHLVQVPIVLGRGVRIWDGLEALEDAYDVEAVSSQRRHPPQRSRGRSSRECRHRTAGPGRAAGTSNARVEAARTAEIDRAFMDLFGQDCPLIPRVLADEFAKYVAGKAPGDLRESTCLGW